jgi:HSP20 family protein
MEVKKQMTNLLVRDPFLAAPFRLMDEILRTSPNGKGVTGFTPPLDVRETADEYWLRFDLPGVKPEDVSIEVNDQLLTVSGTRIPVETGEAHQLERVFGSFVRSLALPKGVDSDTIAADYTHGVLTLKVPKPANAKPKKIAIATTIDAIEK